MTRVAIAASGPAPDAPEFDLWGNVYTLRALTRSVERKIDDTMRRVDDATDTDQAVELLGEMLDALLAPLPGKRKKASALIIENWQADELSVPQLEAFVEQVREAAAAPPS